MDGHARLPDINTFKEFEAFLQPIYDAYGQYLAAGGQSLPDSPPYLDPIELTPHFLQRSDIINGLLDKNKYCGKFWRVGTGKISYKKYHGRMTCKKPWCRYCGGQNGRIYRKTKQRIMKRFGEITEKSAVRQLTITVPMEDRPLFQTDGGPSMLHKIMCKTGRKFFGGEPFIQAFQGFGDKNPGKYHPHVHAVFKSGYGKVLKLSLETLTEIGAYVTKELKKYGCKYEGRFDVHYVYGRGKRQVSHKLKYLAERHPGYTDYKAMASDPDLYYFFMVTLQRFKYIRSYGWPKDLCETGEDEEDELQGWNKVAGERIKWDWTTCISDSEHRLLWHPLRDTELTKDLCRIDDS